MNGDPNSPREDVLGALALVDATIDGMADSRDKLRLAMASSALRRANEKLRGYTDDHFAEVIAFPSPGSSVKVPDDDRDGDRTDVEIYGAGAR